MPRAVVRAFSIGLLATALAFPAKAVAGVVLSTPGGRIGPQPWQRWVDVAKRRLWTPNIVVTFSHATCPDWGVEAYGCAGSSEVWVRVSLRDRVWARWTLDHELGHVVDFAMGDARRAQVGFLLRWRQWRPESFADGWAQCADPANVTSSVLRRLRAFCRLLRVRPPPVRGPSPNVVERPVSARLSTSLQPPRAILWGPWTPLAQTF